MIIKHKIFEKYDNYGFNIPYKAGDRVLVKNGERVKDGTELILKKGSNIKHSFFIPEQIDVELSKIQKFLNCIDGEFVNKGDILAEKVVAGGLNVKKLVSPAQGVVDLSRIESGYLDLLGEEKEILVKSTFKGIIEGVNPVDGIEISSTAYALDLLAISDFRLKTEKGRNLAGEFVILSEGKDLLLRANGSNYEDKIVFVGKYLHTELLHDLFEKGALFVLTYSMEYEDFRKQGLPVGVIGGFGEIYSSKTILDLLYSMNEKFVVVDYEESQLFFITEEALSNTKEDIFVKFGPGNLVVSRSLSNYGMLGRILTMEGEMHATVEWEGGQRSIINIGSLEFVSL